MSTVFIVLFFLPFFLYVQVPGPYGVMSENYGFSITTVIVPLFTFVRALFHLWIMASSPRLTTLLSPVVEVTPIP